MKILKNLLSKFKKQKKYDLDSLGEDSLIIIANEFINNLGGKNNIKSLYSCSTRLRVSLNKDDINIENLISSGAKRVIKLDDLNYQIIVGMKAAKLEEIIKKYLG
ncbi:PTS transporter subunit EIIB [Fusobacterium russii]|uniref:PTS transporter subunit EIIB n=1 Tax=Fusobacterium russii TaxID=854 RepID=UPI0003A45227|nr:PTS transporter subunit EIIB [Fusobacterium russii]